MILDFVIMYLAIGFVFSIVVHRIDPELYESFNECNIMEKFVAIWFMLLTWPIVFYRRYM